MLVKLPDRSPPAPDPPLGQLVSDAILRMKARWYKFNDERGLFYDYDACEYDSDDSDDSEDFDDSDDPL